MAIYHVFLRGTRTMLLEVQTSFHLQLHAPSTPPVPLSVIHIRATFPEQQLSYEIARIRIRDTRAASNTTGRKNLSTFPRGTIATLL